MVLRRLIPGELLRWEALSSSHQFYVFQEANQEENTDGARRQLYHKGLPTGAVGDETVASAVAASLGLLSQPTNECGQKCGRSVVLHPGAGHRPPPPQPLSRGV